MVKSFRFLLNFAWINLGCIISFAVIVIVGCYATGVPSGLKTSNLFETYYAMFPIMILLCLFLYAFALCTSNLDLGLSMGARRGDFFWALQGIMLFYTAVCWVLQLSMSVFPMVANWSFWERWDLLSAYNEKPLTFPLLCLVLLVLGCLSGMVVMKNKILGAILVTVSVLIMMAAAIFMLLSSELDLPYLLSGTRWAWLAELPRIMAAVLAAAFVGGELLIWRIIQRYTVR